MDSHAEKDASLPEGGPPDDLYWTAVPIWCGGSHDELSERLGDEYACGFAAGFENGIVMAMLRPEWAQGFYRKLREYYLTTHSPQDLEDWERVADETARALPIRRVSTNRRIDNSAQAG
ncbi:MAG: hypothetical protein WD904_13370 [Dehalococcoidia bacterium]